MPVSRLIGASFTLYDLVAYNEVEPDFFPVSQPHQRHLFFDNPNTTLNGELLPVAGPHLNELVRKAKEAIKTIYPLFW